MSPGAVRIALALAALAAPGVALATNGYFSHGYGIKAKGMAGVGIALPQDALAAATNPAGMALVGNRMDFGADVFMPRRSGEIAGNGGIPPFGVPPLNGTFSGDGRDAFLIPDFGYNRVINPQLSLGVAVYGNGGMNTSYTTSPFARMGGSSPAGVDLSQLFIAPTVAWRINADHAVGVSLNLAYQRFSAEGLGPFAAFGMSSAPGAVSNVGHDGSTGVGVRVGWNGRLNDTVSVGATYQSKTKMSRFDKYAGLFADQGDFDIPANYGVGIAIRATPALTIAADVQKIDYSGVSAVGNSAASLFGGQLLGSTNGPGFGWRDMTVFKLGASYQVNSALTLRGGLSTGRQPIPSNETFFNILAPGVIEDHVTLGATWQLGGGRELSVAYMHALSKRVNGANSVPPMFGGGEVNLRMHQNSIGVAYGVKF
ncbi:MAG: outer membrane protein transport protein [Burkholderiaceae bacterium]|nr:outer membrane protein transport protein [Burkholderiaceae bacterium]